MLASAFSFPLSFSPKSDGTSNPFHKEVTCSQPASLLHLSAHAIQQSPKLTVKDVLHEIPTNLKDVLKMTGSSPRWNQILSEDHSKTLMDWELPTLLALLNKIPTTLQEPMFIDKNVRVESVENSASACGSTQMDATLATDGRQVYYRQRKIGAITEHLLEAEDGSMMIIALYSGSDESCFCSWFDRRVVWMPLPEAARAIHDECRCSDYPRKRMLNGTVIAKMSGTGPYAAEWRTKHNFPSGTIYAYHGNTRGEMLKVGNPSGGCLLNDTVDMRVMMVSPSSVDDSHIVATFSDRDVTFHLMRPSGYHTIRRLRESDLLIWLRRSRVGCAAAAVDVELSEAFAALEKHIRVRNWEAALPLAIEMASTLDHRLGPVT